jgi:O-antigen/teichoic acid export membrane protein
VLSLYGIARSITGSTYPLFFALKKQNYVTIATFVSAIGLFGSIFPLIKMYGIIGAGFAAIIGSFISLPVSLFLTWKLLYKKHHD